MGKLTKAKLKKMIEQATDCEFDDDGDLIDWGKSDNYKYYVMFDSQIDKLYELLTAKTKSVDGVTNNH